MNNQNIKMNNTVRNECKLQKYTTTHTSASFKGVFKGEFKLSLPSPPPKIFYTLLRVKEKSRKRERKRCWGGGGRVEIYLNT